MPSNIRASSFPPFVVDLRYLHALAPELNSALRNRCAFAVSAKRARPRTNSTLGAASLLNHFQQLCLA